MKKQEKHKSEPVNKLENLRISKYYDVENCAKSTWLKKLSARGEKFLRSVKDAKTYKKLAYKRIPVLEWLPKYRIKEYLMADCVSGFTVGVMNIPQGMAYALLASLSPVIGLYISFFPLIIYAFFGTSRHLAIGSIAVVSLLTGSVVEQMLQNHKSQLGVEFKSTNDTTANALFDQAKLAYKIKVACSLSLLVGVFQILMGVLGLGIISSYFSQAFVSGYTTGSAIHVLTSQIKDILGLKGLNKYNGIFNIPKTIIDILSKLGNTNVSTLILSLIAITYLIIFKEFINPRIKRRFKLEFPSELILVIITTVVSSLLKIDKKFKIDIVGSIPKGLPMPQLPNLSLWPELVKDAFVIAIVAFSINASLGALFARKHKYRIDYTQELIAYGLSNAFGGFFSCYPSAASLSRSSVLESTGGKTSLGPLLSSLVILTVILFLNPYFQPLPKACLACIILVALKTLLFQINDFFHACKHNIIEAIVWIGTFLSVVILDVDVGLLLGIVISLFSIIVRDQLVQLRPLKKFSNSFLDKELVIDENSKAYISDFQIYDAQKYEMIKLQRSLYFANTESFKKSLEKYLKSKEDDSKDDKLRPIESFSSTQKFIKNQSFDEITNQNKENIIPSYLILDFSAVNYIDTDGVKALKQLIDDYKAINTFIYVANFQDCLIKMIFRLDMLEFFDSYLYLTINDAIKEIEKNNVNTEIEEDLRF